MCDIIQTMKKEKQIIAEENKKKKMTKEEFFRFLKFLAFSLSAGVIQLVSSMVLKLVLDAVLKNEIDFVFIIPQDVSTFVADTVGLALSIIWNFTFNRKFTFKSASNVPLAMTLAFLFYIPFYPFQIWYVPMVEQGINAGIWGYLVGLITCMIINFVLEFVWQRYVVFRNTLNSKPLAKTVEMKLQKTPFERMKNGQKKVEMRLNDEKRKALNKGDHILFENIESGEKLKVKIKEIKRFASFDELYKSYSAQDLGYLEGEEAKAEDMKKYYPEKEMSDGVVAIEVENVKNSKV